MTEFLSAFDTTNEVHVRWYMDMIKVAENYTSANIVGEVNKNPMGLVFEHGKVFEWAQIHCMLGAKYAKEVLRGNAWIPNKE